MEELVSGSITFNKFKVKYAYMNEYFLFNQNAQEKKTFYFFIDFDYVFRQYMHSLECFDFRYIDDNFTDNFVVCVLFTTLQKKLPIPEKEYHIDIPLSTLGPESA